MNLFRYDSPMMVFIGKVSDFIVLNILWVICSIPVVTAGAATTAKYSIAMRILRNEETPVVVPFFKEFKANFVQATKIWLILMIAIALCILDWMWIRSKGLEFTSAYVIAVLVLSLFVICMTMSIFPFIARFTVTTGQAFKAAFAYSFVNFIPLVLIAAVELGTVIASIWYARWLIAVAVFGTTTAFYFNTYLAVNKFRQTEESYFAAEEAAEEAVKLQEAEGEVFQSEMDEQ